MFRPEPPHPYENLQHFLGFALGILIGAGCITWGLYTAPPVPRMALPAALYPLPPEPAP